MKHTHKPGPFPLYAENSGEQIAILTNQGNLYAKTFDPCAARLIAAAPDLLAALEALLADKYLSDPINAGRMAASRAAIAKATGRGDA